MIVAESVFPQIIWKSAPALKCPILRILNNPWKVVLMFCFVPALLAVVSYGSEPKHAVTTFVN